MATPGFNFINIARAAFTHKDPKSVKKTDDLTAFLALLGSLRVNAARKTLVKLTPGILKWKSNSILQHECHLLDI